MNRLALALLLVATASSAAAQQPTTTAQRRPLAYLAGTLAVQPIADERLLQVRARLEVPVGARTRPWVSVGTWGVTNTACTLITGGGSCNSGTSLGLGVDATPLAPSSPVQPFVGIGYEAHSRDGSRFRDDDALVRAGADYRLSRWVSARAEGELLTFRWSGAPFELSGGLRLSLPGR